jgi:uncharacterized protein (TIGR02271 family)
MNYEQIERGWDVYDADGGKVGDVQEATGSYLVTEKGFLFPTERYIPRSAITRVEHDRVYLNVRKSDIDSQGWDRKPAAEPATRGEGERMRGEGERVELREEELRARKESVEAGEVGIRKDVVEEHRTMEVPVTREEVTVERRPVDRQPADRPPAGEGETMRVPVREEQVSVEKRPVVTEEVEIGKRQVQDTEEVGGTVRREEAKVEREGDVDLREGEPRR